MDLGIAGRVALVCGGSSGLGYAIAEGLLAEGATIALNGRDSAKLDRAVARLQRSVSDSPDRRVAPFPGDVSRATECAALVERVHDALGGPDILLCNSSGPPAGPFEAHPAEEWQRALEVSLLSAVHLCRAAVPHMRARRWGRVICLTSVAARQPSQALILSTTARAGVLGFAKALSDEVAAQGITVNALCPGYFLTERLRELAAVRGRTAGKTVDEVLAEMGQSLPIRRIGDPAEFAAAAVFLASEPARYITGTTWSVDGGQTRAII
ncbi:MAG TPA: SDR family oxidoreductase [Gemmatimonadales bacterium]|nr:SDR family oxidoreductase [Gemmatimonadales bacterium]